MIFNPQVVYDHDGCQISNLKVSSPPISSTLELYTMFHGKSALETTSQCSVGWWWQCGGMSMLTRAPWLQTSLIIHCYLAFLWWETTMFPFSYLFWTDNHWFTKCGLDPFGFWWYMVGGVGCLRIFWLVMLQPGSAWIPWLRLSFWAQAWYFLRLNLRPEPWPKCILHTTYYVQLYKRKKLW